MSYITINKKHLINNVEVIKKRSGCEVLAVIKDNAYGHGIREVGEILGQHGITRVCVRDVREAKEVKNLFQEILIFFPEEVAKEENFSYAISTLEGIEKYKNQNVHLKFDTGMHRNAIAIDALPEALTNCETYNITIKGVFSHLCCSDEIANDTFIQLNRFKRLREEVLHHVSKLEKEVPKFHLLNSDAIFHFSDFTLFDYVRPGIALYGGSDHEGLLPVMTLIGEKITQKRVKRFQGVGYNKHYISDKDQTVTTIDLGYADGVLYFNHGIQLKTTQAVGKISMDSMGVLGSHEEVVLFDDVRVLKKNFDETITYDILTKLKPSLPRIII